jgi:hypothetical protein
MLWDAWARIRQALSLCVLDSVRQATPSMQAVSACTRTLSRGVAIAER